MGRWSAKPQAAKLTCAVRFVVALSSFGSIAVAGDESGVIGGCVDAGGGVVNDIDEDFAAGLQKAELLEALALFEGGRGQ
jgi:hypothetical protein